MGGVVLGCFGCLLWLLTVALVVAPFTVVVMLFGCVIICKFLTKVRQP